MGFEVSGSVTEASQFETPVTAKYAHRGTACQMLHHKTNASIGILLPFIQREKPIAYT